MTGFARRAVGVVLFALACASSLAARSPNAPRVGGEAAGSNGLLLFAGAVVAVTALLLVLLRRRGRK